MTEVHDTLAQKWHRFRMRAPEDRRLIRKAAFLLPVTEIGLRLFGFRRWKEIIEKLSLSPGGTRPLPAELQNENTLRIVRAVHSAELHGLTHPNCLERSMTLWWILRRAGIDGELRIGARKQGGQFEAHAWVELDGKILNDDANVHRHYAR